VVRERLFHRQVCTQINSNKSWLPPLINTKPSQIFNKLIIMIEQRTLEGPKKETIQQKNKETFWLSNSTERMKNCNKDFKPIIKWTLQVTWMPFRHTQVILEKMQMDSLWLGRLTNNTKGIRGNRTLKLTNRVSCNQL